MKLTLVLSFALLIVPPAWADTPAFISGGFSTNTPFSFTGTKAWAAASTIGGPDFYITQLGVYDSGGDGLANSHAVGVWNRSRTLLASTTIPAGTAAPLIDGYRYMPITPVLMPSDWHSINHILLFGAQYSAGDADDLVTPLSGGYNIHPAAPDIPFVSAYGAYSSDLHYPNFPYYTIVGGDEFYGPPFLEINFQFATSVPEPDSSLLFLFSGAVLGGARWFARRKKRIG